MDKLQKIVIGSCYIHVCTHTRIHTSKNVIAVVLCSRLGELHVGRYRGLAVAEGGYKYYNYD